MITIIGRVETKRDTTANWTYVNPVLLLGEIGLDITINNFKVGDGVSAWADLDYWIIGGTVAPISIVQFVDATPKVIPYTGSLYPDYVLMNLTGSPADLFDKNTNVTYDGSNFTIYGADDGTGHFSDSFTFIIKP